MARAFDPRGLFPGVNLRLLSHQITNPTHRTPGGPLENKGHSFLPTVLQRDPPTKKKEKQQQKHLLFCFLPLFFGQRGENAWPSQVARALPAEPVAQRFPVGRRKSRFVCSPFFLLLLLLLLCSSFVVFSVPLLFFGLGGGGGAGCLWKTKGNAAGFRGVPQKRDETPKCFMHVCSGTSPF